MEVARERSMARRYSTTEPGQPCVRMSGRASSARNEREEVDGLAVDLGHELRWAFRLASARQS